MLIKNSYLLEQYTTLIQACINENRCAQNQLYKFFAPKMFLVCMRYSKNREEAEEIVQEGFIQVFRSLKNYKFAGSFEGWIRKIMVYCAIQYYRNKSKIYPVINIDFIGSDEIETESILSGLGKKDLLKMIQQLPTACRMVFNLHVFEGMKHREISKLLNISEGTSKSNFFDAKKILQRAVINSLKVAKAYY